jgi:hypothetical protein
MDEATLVEILMRGEGQAIWSLMLVGHYQP